VQVLSNGNLKDTFITPSTYLLGDTQVSLGVTPDGRESIKQISREVFTGVNWITDHVSYLDRVSESRQSENMQSENRQSEFLRNKLIFGEDNYFNLPACEGSIVSDSRLGTYIEARLLKEINKSDENKYLSINTSYFPNLDSNNQKFNLGLEYFKLDKNSNSTQLQLSGGMQSDKKINFEFQFERKY
jgi:hypothetical protein